MLTPTPKLRLPQFEATDPFDYLQVNALLLSIETQLTPTVYTTAARPTGVARWDGRVILDSDVGEYLVWNAALAKWQMLRDNRTDSANPIPGTIAKANFTGGSVQGIKRNGMVQIYGSVISTNVISSFDIANVPILELPADWAPSVPATLSGGAAGGGGSMYIGTDGVINLCTAVFGFPAAGIVSFGGNYIGRS